MKNKYGISEAHPLYRHRKRIYKYCLFMLPLAGMLLVEGVARGSLNDALLWVFNRFPVSLYNYMLYLAMYGLMLCIINRLSIAGSLFTLLMIVYAFANYYKLQSLGFYISPLDLLNQSDAGEAASLLIKFVPVNDIISLVLLLFGIVAALLALRNKYRLDLGIRCIMPIMCVLMLLLGGNTFYLYYTPVNDILNMTEYAPYNPSMNFEQNGLLATFFSYAGYNYEEQIRPGNYGQQAIDELTDSISINADYQVSDEMPDKVIIILVESLMDPLEMDKVSISPDPIADIREDFVGVVISPSYGGSTGNAEFEVLTGYSLYPVPRSTVPFAQFNRRLPSLAWYFKDLGYSTMGIHTHQKDWYRRSEIYPLLGLDTFISSENMSDAEYRGLYISDQEMARQLIKHTDTQEKQFVFALTMENHGPYIFDKFENVQNPVQFEVSGDVTEEERQLVLNYVKGTCDANEMYRMIKDHFRESDQKVVIALVGDHPAHIGDSLTSKLGYFEDDNDVNRHHVQLALWSNYLDEPEKLQTPISFNYLGVTITRYSGLPQSKFQRMLYQLQQGVPVVTIWPPETLEYNDMQQYQQQVDQYSMLIYDALYGQQYADEIYFPQ